MATVSLSTTLLLIFFSLPFQIINANKKNECFEVLEDQLQVEKIAVEYAEWRKSFKEELQNFYSRKKNICNCSKEEKLAFCEKTIQINYYGLDFELENYEHPTCEPASFTVKYITNLEENYFEVPMFECPRLYYTTLDTLERRYLPYTYRVSKGKTDKEAIVYFTHTTGDALTVPQKYIDKISFSKLRDNKEEFSHLLPHPSKEASSLELTITNYSKAKRILKVYLKFTLLFNALNVCHQSRSVKIYLCRKYLKYYLDEEKLDIEDYDEEKCRKHRIRFESEESENLPPRLPVMSVVRCPPTVNISILEEPKDTTSYYIASNSQRRSITVFSRANQKGGELQPRVEIKNLETFLIHRERRRASFLPYADERQRHETPPAKLLQMQYENDINSHISESVQMPTTIARYSDLKFKHALRATAPLTFIQNRWKVEDSLISFSEIKTKTLVYEKFRRTYWSIDICQLTDEQKKDICYEALEKDPYYLKRDKKNPESTTPCIRQKIILTSRDAEKLLTDIFSVWKCPESANQPSRLFYLGKSHLTDAAFLYRSPSFVGLAFPPLIYPDALLIRINRYKLAEIALSEESRLRLTPSPET